MLGRPRWLDALVRFACCTGLLVLGAPSSSAAQPQDGRQWLEFTQVYKGRPAGFYYLASNDCPVICDAALAALNEPRPTADVSPEDRYEEFLLGSPLKPGWAKVKDRLSWRRSGSITKVRILDAAEQSMVRRRYFNLSANAMTVLTAVGLKFAPGAMEDEYTFEIPAPRAGESLYGPHESELRIDASAAQRDGSAAPLAEDLAWLLSPHSGGHMLDLMVIDQRAYVLVSKTEFTRKPISVALLQFHAAERASILCHFRSRFGFDGQAVRK